MNRLKGKKILLGITAGIAAYKILSLIRLLKKEEAEVRVVMTPNAKAFIGTVSPATLSEHAIASELFDPETGEWTRHVELGLWADLMLVAPLTASTLSKMASGQSDNLLLTIYLSARCPVMVSPAMDLDMWQHPSTQRNLNQLKQDGVEVIPPASGPLASGLQGPGRLPEPEELLEKIVAHFHKTQRFKGKRVMITLGPTQEDLDPVRFISNHSTGKMGAEIGKAFLNEGAEVCLIAGPVKEEILPSGARIRKVRSAIDMLNACQEEGPESDILVFCAAVADYRPAEKAEQKIKKSGDRMVIELVKNPDIAAEMGSRKKANQFLLGFALETQLELEHARAKRERKNLDAIVLNSLRDSGAGFGVDTNKITLLDKNGTAFPFETKSKKEVAHDIVAFVHQQITS
jgi:phosphopantothenoylcysteine decarboxylase/phosphopantothenate--cysteine ligase